METKYKTAYPYPTESDEYHHYTFERGKKDSYNLEGKGVIFTDPIAYTKAVKEFYSYQPGDIVHLPSIFNSPLIVVERLDVPVIKAVIVQEYEYEKGKKVYSTKEVGIPLSIFLAVSPGAQIVEEEKATKVASYIFKVDKEENEDDDEEEVGNDFIASVIAGITQPGDSF